MLLGLQYDSKMRIAPQIGIASYITNFGHDVTWILFSEEQKEFQEPIFNDVRVFAVPCKYKGNGFLRFISKALYAIRRMRFVFKNFRNEGYNMIFVRDGVFDGLLALYIKRRYKVPFVFEMSNPIEQNWETHKLYSKNKCFWYFISKIDAHLTMHILHTADLVLPISKWLKEDFVKKGIERSKILPLPEGVDISRFSDVDGEAIRRQYNLKDSNVVVYVGTMDKMRHLDILVHAFSKVKKSRKDVKLLMVGDGNDKSNLERLAGELGIRDDVVFTGNVYSHEIPHFIAAADVGVSPVPPLDFYKLSSPIKMFEYMAMSKPVVANDEIPEQEEVMQESGGGVLVKFEAESFAEGIVELLDDVERAEEMGRMGYRWVVKNRSYENMAREVEGRYFEVLERAI
ncbi:MAG: D-inositol-3-phosphate glycosyltransferase [Candidatus Argoarchaeum ethanivorans]|uniref:D-inositol-3-phosphate glycosyltransferase n=1 Tax=Candidatus Argoarchaeum ethanivorans TaxID=2608793 RepID=A0A811T7L3_9EURY|nr:MAG: D-inositol-3-phosphate glycosyltransferase [Candidatus Argoarchaeum ethanivorans]